MLYIYRGNIQEVLLEELKSKCLQRQTIDSFAFDEDVILVQNKGMQRWITYELAKKAGIATNLRFEFPMKLMWQLYKSVNQFAEADVIVSKKEFVQFQLFDLLQTEFANHKTIQGYLHTETVQNTQLKKWQLSATLASLFDEYELFRTTELDAKIIEESKLGDWQFQLFKQIKAQNKGRKFRHELQNELIEKLRTNSVQVPFKRLFIYGIPTLPESTIRALLLLSKHCEVHFFQLTPTPDENWSQLGEKFNQHELLEILSQEGREQASWISRILGEEKLEFEEKACFKPIKAENSLTLLQKSLYETKIIPQNNPTENDTSVLFTSHYSAQREVETLRDHLITAFENQKEDLKPGDILVMSSDINRYAPFVDYYFNEAVQGGTIPFTIADTKISSEDEALQSVIDLIALLKSPFKRSELLNWLAKEPVRLKAEFEISDLIKCRKWLENLNVRWGINSEQKDADWGDFSFNFGREKLFNSLFYFPSKTELKENQYIPLSINTSEELRVWSSFEALMRKLEHYQKVIQTEKTIQEWVNLITELVNDFVFVPEYSVVYKKLADLTIISTEAAPKTAISIDLFEGFFTRYFDSQSVGSGFLQGKVTFSAMVPLRSIPFKYVCLLGLNDGQFPGKKIRASFDWISLKHKPGDRDRKTDDYYLLLESILSARKQLYLSYLGRSTKDDAQIPASPIVTTLMETLQKLSSQEVQKIEHRLYSHSIAYFGTKEKARLNYNASAFEILKSSLKTNEKESLEEEPIFVDSNFSLSLNDFLKLWENPAAYFLEKQKNVSSFRIYEDSPDDESFKLDGLETYRLKEDLYSLLSKNKDFDREKLFQINRQKGLIEAASNAKQKFDSVFDEVFKVCEYVQEKIWENEPALEQELSVSTNTLEIKGSYLIATDKRLVFVRFSDLSKSKYKLRIKLVGHFLANALNKPIVLEVIGKEGITKTKTELFTPNSDFFNLICEKTAEALTHPIPFQVQWSESLSKIGEADKSDLENEIFELSQPENGKMDLKDTLIFDKIWKEANWTSSLWAYELAKEIFKTQEVSQ